MNTQIEKINPKEFGLDENNVATIEQAFMPMIVERDGLRPIYEQLLTSEITPELCREAGHLRRKLVKVRTGIADIHKTQKAFFLAAGRFVDAWKNKETEPVTQMEERLSEIETHFEKLEAQRIAKLTLERSELVAKYTEFPASGLGQMAEQVFEAYLTGLKVAHDAKIEAEKKAEAERLRIEAENQLHRDRKESILHLWNFTTDEQRSLNFGQIEQTEWDNMLLGLQSQKSAHEAEQARIKAENERLAKERAELEAKRKAESEAAEKERQRIEAERAKERAESERKQRELQAQLKAKEEAEKASKAEADRKERERIEAEKKAATAPDKDKLTNAINSMTMPELTLESMLAATIAADIKSKFESFKRWALKEIENL